MRFLPYALLFILVSCSGSEATEAELNAAAEAGHRDALKAVYSRDKGMECERAILQIRARERKMRDAGFSDCADEYVLSAQTTLRDSLIIP